MQGVSAFPRRPLSLAGTLLFNSRTFPRAQRRLTNLPNSALQRGVLQTAAHTMSSLANGIAVAPSTHETYGNFDLVKRVKLNFTDVTVSKWRSRVTGLSIVHLDYEGHSIWRLGMQITNYESSPDCEWVFCCCDGK